MRPRLQAVPLWSSCQGGPVLSVQVGAFEVSLKLVSFPVQISFLIFKIICVKSH